MKDHSGRIIGIHQQISLALIVAPDFNLSPAELMEIMGKAGVKFTPDDTEVMLDASQVYKMEEDKIDPKRNLKVVKDDNSAEDRKSII